MITYAYLETTNYCNLACRSCNREEVIGALQHMPVFKFRELVGKLGPDIKEAKLMGMGEPFLHPGFSQICQIFKEAYPGSFLISSTNCQFTPGENFRNSLKNIDLLYLSIDGYGNSYERDRPPAKWSKLISFLEELRDMERHGCRMAINYTVTPINVTDISKTNELLREFNLDELRLNLVQDWSQDSNSVGTFTDDQLSYLREHWGHAIKGKSQWEFSDCFWVDSGVYVSVNGDVKVCCMNTSARSMGNIFTDPLTRIHNTQSYVDVKRGCKTNNPTEHCINCSYSSLKKQLNKVGV